MLKSLYAVTVPIWRQFAGNLRWRLVRNGLHPQPASPVSTRQNVKSARNRADPYIRLLLGTRLRNMIHLPDNGEQRGTGAMLHWILPRLAAYVAVVVAAGLLFLAGASVYALMWPKPVVPFGQMGP
jgi:hypothetical protein